MNDLAYILLMGAPKEGENPIMTFLPLILIVVVFYFFMIRPQQKKSKEQKSFREGISKGDKIITIGGVHGKIVDIKEKTMTIEVEGGMRMKIERSAVSLEYTSGNKPAETELQEK